MTIEFNFKLNDVDASNLVSILHDAMVSAKERRGEYMAQYDTSKSKVALANADWYEGHSAYLEGLKQKVIAGGKRVDS